MNGCYAQRLLVEIWFYKKNEAKIDKKLSFRVTCIAVGNLFIEMKSNLLEILIRLNQTLSVYNMLNNELNMKPFQRMCKTHFKNHTWRIGVF